MLYNEQQQKYIIDIYIYSSTITIYFQCNQERRNHLRINIDACNNLWYLLKMKYD